MIINKRTYNGVMERWSVVVVITSVYTGEGTEFDPGLR